MFSRVATARAASLAAAAVGAVLGDEPKQVGRDPADVVGPGQRVAQRAADAVDLDDLARRRRPVAASQASTTTGLLVAHTPSESPDRVVDVVFGDVKTELPHLFCRQRRGQHGVAAQRCEDGIGAGERLSSTTVPGLARLRRAAAATRSAHFVIGSLVVGLAFGAVQELGRAEIGQPAVDRLGVAAEVGVGAVADAEHRVAHAVERGRIRRIEATPEVRPVVRRPTVAECAGDDQNVAGRREPRQRPRRSC